jgi:phage terminase Nu1 subunit (DNA packaging protein)
MDVSGDYLSQLSGFAWRTIRKRLDAAGIIANERGKFDSVPALRAIFGIEAEKASALDLSEERALLARAQRERIEVEAAVRRGELLEAETVAHEWANHVGAVRSRLLALPHRLSPRLVHADEITIAAAIRSEVHGALRELAGGEQDADTTAH